MFKGATKQERSVKPLSWVCAVLLRIPPELPDGENEKESLTLKNRKKMIHLLLHRKVQYRISRSVTVLIPDDELPCFPIQVGPKFLFYFRKGKKVVGLFDETPPSVVSRKKKFCPACTNRRSEKRNGSRRCSSTYLGALFPGPSHLIQNGGSFVRLLPRPTCVCSSTRALWQIERVYRRFKTGAL